MKIEESVLTDSTKKNSRRNFLLAVGAGSAATAAALVAKSGDAVKAAPAASANARHDKGYEESAHVRNYYRTARV